LVADCNLSEMGTGKTLSTIMIIDTLLKEGKINSGKILYIGPASTLGNLAVQFKRHAPHLKIAIVDGSFNQRMAQIVAKDRPDVYIANFEMMNMKLKLVANGNTTELKMADIVGCVAWDMVIIDEVHKIKNPDAQRTQNILTTFRDVPYKIIMSGTITANKMFDVHCPFIFLNNARQFNSVLLHRNGEPLSYGELVGDFLQKYFRREGGSWKPLTGTAEELREKLAEVSVRFTKKECLDLPDKVYDVRLVDLSPNQQRLYNELRDKLQADLEDSIGKEGKVSVLNVRAMNMKLQEAANGWIYDSYHRAISFPENPKLDAMMELLDDIGDEAKTICWGIFKEDIRIMYNRIKETYGYESVAIIDGSVDRWKRDEIQEKFNDPNSELRYVVCNILAAGHGIDLIGASHEIFLCNTFRKVERTQAQARADRPGMQESLTIHDIVARNTADEKVIGAIRSWKSMDAALTENLGIDPKYLDATLTDEEPAIEMEFQGEKECMLAAIAMASHIPYLELRMEVLAITGKVLWEFDIPTILTLVLKYFGTQVHDEFKAFYDERTNAMTDIDTLRKMHLDMSDINIPTTGTGFIFLAWLGKTFGHIVVYRNGMIYDSGYEKPKEMGEWLPKVWEMGGVLTKVISLNGE
jgi:SNF2 family DNA or RNA helicase